MPIWLAWTVVGVVGAMLLFGIVGAKAEDTKEALFNFLCALVVIACVGMFIWAAFTLGEHYNPRRSQQNQQGRAADARGER